MEALIHDIRLPFGATEKEAILAGLKKAGLKKDTPAFVLRRSLDTRRNEPTEVFTIALTELYKEISYDFSSARKTNCNVLVTGFGPAGMFAAYLLAKCGFKPTVAERGRAVAQRVKDVEMFWKTGILDTTSNVQFGEGGAGTFSDGKLTTRINDPRCRFVLRTFRSFGASENILTDAKPHIGTDTLRTVVQNMRDEIIRLGGRILYETKLTDLQTENGQLKKVFLNGEPFDFDAVILSTGNGACDTYRMLLSRGITVENKAFSVGVRTEYLQRDINRTVYGKRADDPRLPPADFQFYTHLSSGTVYTFCMCPGGYVVNSSSEEGHLVTNGMSYTSRGGENANAALLATVDAKNPFDAIEIRASVEKAAYLRCGGLAPVNLADNFLEGTKATSFGKVKPTFLPGTGFDDLTNVFPKQTLEMLRTGLAEFGKKFYYDKEGVLTGAETRTSAPLRIVRDDTMQSPSAKGLFPCGEGAGYAGGIMSAAVDGLRVAETICGIMPTEGTI